MIGEIGTIGVLGVLLFDALVVVDPKDLVVR
jgi:hypothetical protein